MFFWKIVPLLWVISMKVKPSLLNIAIRSLAQSMNVHTMEHLVHRLLPNYDLNKRTGFPHSISIPNLDAARQIIYDINESALFPQFVNILVEISNRGWMGKKYDIAYLHYIVKEMREHGFVYDAHNKMFVEDHTVRRTRNWGVLREGHEYVLTFLRFDIVGNSELVRKYSTELINFTYSDFGEIVKQAINPRNGRIWTWEGDGGLIAFYFSHKNQMAVLSGMEILHELFLYNRLQCRLSEPLRVRIAVHCGNCDYSDSEEELKKLDPVRKTIQYESLYTSPNSLTISEVVHTTLDDIVAREFSPIESPEKTKLYSYRFAGEK
jgi:class 3 adenylate cyclase